jgi:glycogen(starch) synthase
MFVFNTMQGDLRVHRQAQTLASQGYDVRVYCFLEPGLAEIEKRGGYAIYRVDQRPLLTRIFDDKIVRRWNRPKPATPPTPVHFELPPDRAAQRPCARPAPRVFAPGGSQRRAQYRAYVAHINQRWVALARGWKPDFCQAHDVDAMEAAGTLAAELGCAFVYDAHEIWNEQPFVHDEEEAIYWKALERRFIRKAGAILTVNHLIAGWMEQEYGVGPVLCLYNCQELEPLPAPREKLSARVGGRPVALYQGVIGLDRGLEELLASARHQREIVIAIRGAGERLAALRELARQHELDVLFLDAVPSSQVVAAAAEADIGLIPFLPSCMNHYWSTPNKLFEYMMAGLPMAGSDIPELQTFVADNGLGRLFDPYSPADIAASLTSMEGLAAMGSRARQLAQDVYCWERESQKLLQVYEDLRPPR